jgi:two-component system sensor histidine kinase/response regulator
MLPPLYSVEALDPRIAARLSELGLQIHKLAPDAPFPSSTCLFLQRQPPPEGIAWVAVGESDDPTEHADALARGALTFVAPNLGPRALAHRLQCAAREAAELRSLSIAKFREQALDAGETGFWEYHLQSGRIRFSEAMARLRGLDPSILAGRPELCQEAGRPEDVARLKQAGRGLAKGQIPNFHEDLHLNLPDGGRRVLLATGEVLEHDSSGNVVRIGGVNIDMTDRAAVEEALSASLARLRDVGRATSEFLWECDVGGRLVWLSERVEALLGRPAAELLGRPLAELGPPVTTGSWSGFVPHPDGEPRWMAWSGHTIHDSRGEVRGSRGAALDLSAERRRQEALAKALERAKAETRSKSAFVANMSEEIRGPILGILAMGEHIATEDLEPAERARVEVLLQSARELLRLLEDVLDYSALEDGRLELDNHPFDPTAEVDMVLPAALAGAFARGVAVLADIDTGPLRVIGDPPRFRQIVAHLCRNAAKFTEKGQIRLRLEADPDSFPTTRLRFSVTDTGEGMRPEQLARLFLPFTQADMSTTRRHGGAGIGLALCKGLVERMGGSLQVESESGRGTQVHVILDLPSAPLGPPPPDLRGLQVLVVEAQPTLRTLWSRALSSVGAGVVEAGSVPEALSALAWANWRVDAVITALDQAPVEGSTLLRILAHHPTLSTIPRIGIAADGDGPRKSAAAAVTGSHFLPRPVCPGTLRLVLGGLLGRSPAFGTTAGKGTPSLRVLLVEDDPTQQRVIREQLAILGLNAQVVSDGHQALEAHAAGAATLILLDCHLPGLDGFATARAIRSGRDGHLPRIVALTASRLPADADRCREAGMNGILYKPIRLWDLAEALFRWCGDAP